ncbi:MAG TPA: TniQ family protein [Burkholderiaceae bacterium]
MTDDRQLPVRLEPAPSESGLGFILRALRANGIPFDRGVQWLNFERHRPMDRANARRVAWSLNVDADQFGERLVTRDPGGGKGWVRLAGQRLRRQVAPNVLYAKLCPQCVRERGVTRLSWLLRAAVGCPFHGYSLIWTCPTCGRGIGWDRPAVDLCRCGRHFRCATAPPLESGVRGWLCWLEAALSSSKLQPTVMPAFDKLPMVLRHLSVDGAFRIIEAMGMIAAPGQSVRGAMSKCSAPRELGAVIARGLERLSAIEADLENAPRFGAVTNQVALARLFKDCAAIEDQSLAWWLLNAMRSDIDPGATRAGTQPKWQLPLFVT